MNINLVIALLGIISSAMFLYYWGKSGYDYDGKREEND